MLYDSNAEADEAAACKAEVDGASPSRVSKMVKYDICMNCGTYHSYFNPEKPGRKRCMVCGEIADHETITFEEYKERARTGKKGKYAQYPWK